MSIQAAWTQTLDFFTSPIVIEPSAAQLSSDAGLLPFRQLDQQLGLTEAFAEALDDPRDPDLIEHTALQMVRSRYDEYVERGDGENRIKEIKCGLGMDRLSDHRFCANSFRLYLHGLA